MVITDSVKQKPFWGTGLKFKRWKGSLRTYKPAINLVLPFVVVFYSFCLSVPKTYGVPPLYTDEKQTPTQPLAKEFHPCQTESNDRIKTPFSISRSFQTEFTLQNTGPSYKNCTYLWCYLPLSNGYAQIVPKVSATDEAMIFRDSYGNMFLRFEVKDIPPYATQIVRVDSEVLKSTKAMKSSPSDDNTDHLKKYLMPEELVEADHPKIKELAQKLALKSTHKENHPADYQTAQKIFTWVAENITYSGYDQQDKGALHGLIYREGDCTEQAALFTAICRASNIPAKLILGYRCPGNCQGTERMHTWSEFYAGGVWHLADITNKVFDQENENYIGLVNYHSLNQNPLGKHHLSLMDFTFEDTKTRIDMESVVRVH